MPPALRPLLLLAVLAAAAGCESQGTGSGGEPEDVAVHVELVALDERNIPVVILEEDEGTRQLPIWIGIAEARSIAAEMEREPAPRPNTHDLAKRLIHGLEGEVARVVVTELRGGTYYALIELRANGRQREIDSRPSDAIAIALRVGAPIFVRATLFESATRIEEPEDPGQPIAVPEVDPIGSGPATPLRTL